MNSEASALVMISIAVAAPAGSPRPGDHVVAGQAEHVHRHLAGDELDAQGERRVEQLAGLATLFSFASLPIIHGPMPKKFIFVSFTWLMPGAA